MSPLLNISQRTNKIKNKKKERILKNKPIKKIIYQRISIFKVKKYNKKNQLIKKQKLINLIK